RYSPLRHPDRAQQRRELVIDRMVDLNLVDKATAAQARAEALEIAGLMAGAVRRAPWAVDAAVDMVEEEMGSGSLSSSGLQVHTHIQPLLQRAAQQAVIQGMVELDQGYPKAAGAQAALVAVRISNGAVVAMVGGRKYADSPFNRATQAWRQAGSTVKPLTLLAALDEQPTLTPISVFVDEPISLQIDGRTWTPRNYDGQYVGEISLRRAIETSRNIPAIKLAQSVGSQKQQQFFLQAGLTKATDLPSAALGAFAATPLQMAGAYTAFPGGGTAHEPQLVSAVIGTDGSLVHQYPNHPIRLASTNSAAVATSILEGAVTDGTATRAARYGVTGPAGGKTGTTDDYRDAWFVGFTPELAIAVWVGQDRGTLGLSGSRAALPTWARFAAASGTLGGDFPTPDGIEHADVCSQSRLVARPACPDTYLEVFRLGTVPEKDKCKDHGGPFVDMNRLFGGIFKRRPKNED
ncbi:MAG: hypothetical protein HN348_21000, partial [Proteobacteria bacterium]|nr:hypothetical protein [Pseudomonadota bacterium]